MAIHKLTQLVEGTYPVRVVMLCRPSETGKNDEPKTFNTKFVDCPRCKAFIENGFEERYRREGWKQK